MRDMKGSDKEKMSNFAIVIGRQFGSGGRRIGRKVAEKLGIAYYDTELLGKCARKIGIREEVFKLQDEKKPSVLRALLQGAYGIADNFHSVDLTGENLYEAQSRVIRDVCKEEPCVIVGRTADIILRDRVPVFSVFLHSPADERARRIHQRGEAATLEEARELARSHDRRREAFYNYYSGDKTWGQASNYHLTIDTSSLEEEEVAQLIAETAKKRLRQK